MKTCVGVLTVAALWAVTGALSPPLAKEVDRAAFAKEGERLTADAADRLAKVSALHRFVRDEIRQVKTSYS